MFEKKEILTFEAIFLRCDFQKKWHIFHISSQPPSVQQAHVYQCVEWYFLLKNFTDVSVSDMNDDDNGAGGSSKSNSITSEHSMQSTGISASSQGSSTNSLPKGVPIPHQGGSGQHAGGGGSGGVAALSLGGASAGGHHPAASSGGPNADPNATSSQSQIDAAVYGQHGGGNSSGGHQQHHHYSNTPTSFHRPTLAQAQGGPSPSLSAKSKLSQVRCCPLLSYYLLLSAVI